VSALHRQHAFDFVRRSRRLRRDFDSSSRRDRKHVARTPLPRCRRFGLVLDVAGVEEHRASARLGKCLGTPALTLSMFAEQLDTGTQRSDWDGCSFEMTKAQTSSRPRQLRLSRVFSMRSAQMSQHRGTSGHKNALTVNIGIGSHSKRRLDFRKSAVSCECPAGHVNGVRTGRSIRLADLRRRWTDTRSRWIVDEKPSKSLAIEERPTRDYRKLDSERTRTPRRVSMSSRSEMIPTRLGIGSRLPVRLTRDCARSAVRAVRRFSVSSRPTLFRKPAQSGNAWFTVRHPETRLGLRVGSPQCWCPERY